MKRTALVLSLSFLVSGCATQRYVKGYDAGMADAEVMCHRATAQSITRARTEGYVVGLSKSTPSIREIMKKKPSTVEE